MRRCAKEHTAKHDRSEAGNQESETPTFRRIKVGSNGDLDIEKRRGTVFDHGNEAPLFDERGVGLWVTVVFGSDWNVM